jgi:hypothetical protein
MAPSAARRRTAETFHGEERAE